MSICESLHAVHLASALAAIAVVMRPPPRRGELGASNPRRRPTTDTDPYSLLNITAGTGAQAWWNAGYTGKGIDVAVIDTGVSPVPGLNVAGKVVNGPDLSLESQATRKSGNTVTYPFRYLDSFGHGTFMAGLIAAETRR
jgi:subtilisin family serine protease